MKKFCMALLLAACSVLAGCASLPAEKAEPAPVSLMNYTFNAEPHELSFPRIPERVIVCGTSAADTLFALGAGDRVVCLSLTGSADEEIYRGKFPKAEILSQPPAREYAVMLKPDLLIGWRRFFDAKQLGDTLEWSRQGIPAYIEEASGPIPALENFPPCTVESEKTFIRNMGKILRQEEKAEDFVKEIDKELEKGVSSGNHPKPCVLVVEFMGRGIEAFGKNLLSGDIITRVGGELLEFGSPFISKEELMMAQADVIFVVYHGDEAAEAAALTQMSASVYQRIKAVKQGKVYPLRYEQIVAPAIHTSETVRYMRERIYGK